MILKIEKKIEDKYYLVSNDQKRYQLSFKFFDLPANPDKGDYIEIKDVLLDSKYEEYDNLYLFGPLEQPYGRDVKSKKENDVVTLLIKGKKFYLKRFFG